MQKELFTDSENSKSNAKAILKDMKEVEKAKKIKVDFIPIYDQAVRAGYEAMFKCTPTPMVVQEHENQLDDNSPVKQQWGVDDGVCGFAWVVVRPGNCKFVNWFKKVYKPKEVERYSNVQYHDQGNHIIGGSHYGGGFSFWMGMGEQSMQKKEAFGEAFAEVLRNVGLRAYCYSRMD